MNVELTFNKFFSRPIKANLSLIGKVQAENAALAALCAKILFNDISEDIIEKGLENAFLFGRFEILENPFNPRKKIILDGAHTVNSILGTIDSFRKTFQNKANLVFGAAKDKDIQHIAKELIDCQLFEKAFLTKPGSVKQSDLSLVEKAFQEKAKNQFTFVADENYTKILESAFLESGKENKHLLITGSFYLIAEAKKVLCAISSKNSSDNE